MPGEGVIATEDELRAYECDGAHRLPDRAHGRGPADHHRPGGEPSCASATREKVKVVPRGAGTSLSGGALPLTDGIVLGLGKFNRILDIDFENRTVTAQPGVTNLGITKAVEHRRLLLRARPLLADRLHHRRQHRRELGRRALPEIRPHHQQRAGLELVLPNGDVVRLGGKHLDTDGYDLLGLMTGSEGLLGVVTEVTVRILQKPETARAVLIGFPSVDQGGDCVASIIAAGIIPGGLEMMDHPAINAAEDFCDAGYPRDVESLLICELDGPAAEVDHLIGIVGTIARQHGCTYSKVSESEAERLRLLGRPQERLPRRRPPVARLSLHGRHHPAQAARLRAGADAGDVRRNTACASPTSSTPATATCTR